MWFGIRVCKNSSSTLTLQLLWEQNIFSQLNNRSDSYLVPTKLNEECNTILPNLQWFWYKMNILSITSSKILSIIVMSVYDYSITFVRESSGGELFSEKNIFKVSGIILMTSVSL